MLDQAYDAIAVDARVAGSTAAALWGDAGYRTLPVDRAAFPGPTLSTRFFRGGGLGAVLNRLGVLDQVLALGYPPLVCEYLYQDGNPEPKKGPPQNPGDREGDPLYNV